ncbi:MAG: DedA family protein [Patescibacteria group bacterium]|jgi:membrane protein DedA with SNARE-associated domain|nr:DedA family protein [Patescibacteria group bacterium]
MFSSFIQFFLGITADLGYLGVTILMAIESSFLPFPSEIIVPPAAYLASQGEMNIYLVVLFGVLGSVIGAVINYFLSLSLGRYVIYKLANHRLAKFIFISPEKIARAEKYFLANSKSATFLGRLIPVIRQLVSIPAGFSKMNFLTFVSLTALGSFIWVSILAALGYFIGANPESFHGYYQELSWVLVILALFYIIWKIRKGRGNVVDKKDSI